MQDFVTVVLEKIYHPFSIPTGVAQRSKAWTVIQPICNDNCWWLQARCADTSRNFNGITQEVTRSHSSAQYTLASYGNNSAAQRNHYGYSHDHYPRILRRPRDINRTVALTVVQRVGRIAIKSFCADLFAVFGACPAARCNTRLQVFPPRRIPAIGSNTPRAATLALLLVDAHALVNAALPISNLAGRILEQGVIEATLETLEAATMEAKCVACFTTPTLASRPVLGVRIQSTMPRVSCSFWRTATPWRQRVTRGFRTLRLPRGTFSSAFILGRGFSTHIWKRCWWIGQLAPSGID
mmetsp:Transcript_33603/g.66120  ORF Transcript_33603/g.66120 Transcript_33603/m.66120 type:complete len:296 (+) Transcript_33603:445-1332(+)